MNGCFGAVLFPPCFFRTLEQLSRNHIISHQCWWKEIWPTSLRLVYPIIYRVLYIPDGLKSPISSINSFTLSPAIQVNHPSETPGSGQKSWRKALFEFHAQAESLRPGSMRFDLGSRVIFQVNTINIDLKFQRFSWTIMITIIDWWLVGHWCLFFWSTTPLFMWPSGKWRRKYL